MHQKYSRLLMRKHRISIVTPLPHILFILIRVYTCVIKYTEQNLTVSKISTPLFQDFLYLRSKAFVTNELPVKIETAEDNEKS